MNQYEKSAIVRKWMADNQGKHKCKCGCGGLIVIQIQHSARGIPDCIRGHSSRIKNPMSGRFGRANPHFKGGRYKAKSGYIFVLAPRSREVKYIAEHRLVMERKLRRRLRPGELVHHKNRNRSDNRLENLEVMTRSEHNSLHAAKLEIGFGYHRKWNPAKRLRTLAARKAG